MPKKQSIKLQVDEGLTFEIPFPNRTKAEITRQRTTEARLKWFIDRGREVLDVNVRLQKDNSDENCDRLTQLSEEWMVAANIWETE